LPSVIGFLRNEILEPAVPEENIHPSLYDMEWKFNESLKLSALRSIGLREWNPGFQMTILAPFRPYEFVVGLK
jgi:hypothetical protein